MLKVLALRCKERLDNELFTEILSLIDEENKNKILKFYKWHDAQRSLLGNLLIRSTLCDILQVKNRDIKIVRSQMGKPYANNIPEVFFNTSHSGDWIVGAFDSSPVGIDIEQIKPIESDMTRKILDNNDFEEMKKQKESEYPNYFYKCWTFNESYMKMLGRGMSFPLSSVKKLSDEAFFKNYFIDPDYVLSVCSSCSAFPENVIFADIKKLIKCRFLSRISL